MKEKKQRIPSHHAPVPQSGGHSIFPLDKYLPVACAAYLGLIILESIPLYSGGPGWGLSFVQYLLPGWDALFVLALPLLLLLPAVLGKAAGLFGPRPMQQESSSRYWLTAAFITAVLVTVSTQLHVLFPLLGDGSSYAAEIIRIRADAAYNTFLIKPTSWLTGVLIEYIARHSATVDTTWPFALTGTIALGILAAGFFAFTRRDTTTRRVLAGSMVFFTSASLFFLGYVELYAMQFAFTALFFLSMLYGDKNGAPRFMPALLLLAAVLSGGSSIVFLPALCIYVFENASFMKRLKTRTVVIGTAMIQLCAIAAVYGLAGLTGDHQYLLSISPNAVDINGKLLNEVTYTVFSGRHLADVTGAYLLNCGPALFILAALSAKRKSFRLSDDRRMAVLLTALLSGFFVLIFGNTMFGLARDWDMASIATLPVNFMALEALFGAMDRKLLHPGRTAVIVACTMLAAVYGWVRVNTSEASVRRFDDLLAMSEESISVRWTCNGLENLRKYYVKYSKQDDIYRVLKRMAVTRFNTLDTFEKMFEMAINGYRPDKVMDDLLALFKHEAQSPFAENDTRHIPPLLLRQKAVSMLFDAMQMGFIARDDERVTGLHNAFGEWHAIGFIDAVLDSTKAPDAKAAAAEAALDGQALDALLAGTIGRLYAQTGDKEKAVMFLRKALDLDPGRYPEMYMALADILYGDMKDRAGAVEVLELGVRQCRLSPSLPQLKQMLISIANR
jgi:tetratricopeptide (TPR) repeat protein